LTRVENNCKILWRINLILFLCFLLQTSFPLQFFYGLLVLFFFCSPNSRAHESPLRSLLKLEWCLQSERQRGERGGRTRRTLRAFLAAWKL
jgi:hypothetical protein